MSHYKFSKFIISFDIKITLKSNEIINISTDKIVQIGNLFCKYNLILELIKLWCEEKKSAECLIDKFIPIAIKVFEDMRKIVQGTTLIISHQERILNIADEVILLNNGKIEVKGKKGDFIKFCK